MTQILCSCSCHPIDADDPNTIIFNEKQWALLCALKESIHILGESEREATKLRNQLRMMNGCYEAIVNKIKSCLCPNCCQRVDEEWTFAEGSIWCKRCANELPYYDVGEG